jgi:hypothetical protein
MFAARHGSVKPCRCASARVARRPPSAPSARREHRCSVVRPRQRSSLSAIPTVVHYTRICISNERHNDLLPNRQRPSVRLQRRASAGAAPRCPSLRQLCSAFFAVFPDNQFSAPRLHIHCRRHPKVTGTFHDINVAPRQCHVPYRVRQWQRASSNPSLIIKYNLGH